VRTETGFPFSSGTAPELGSPGKLWELLQEAAVSNPVTGNAQGSYTTMKSNGGILFAAVSAQGLS
jgi:Na+/proline symporter